MAKGNKSARETVVEESNLEKFVMFCGKNNFGSSKNLRVVAEK
jgi:hypothetical protein